ncbi:helix-turn-helix transcriptional regulator [Nocardia sp. NPDC005998]|uniref:helix-turn-helix domain-containing protein n=1 Tax=Nocardia sp. NPDC005998 TaxID=3156894 RepID=UPI0033A1876A
MTTGQTIRRIRKSIGMTQAELGALLHLTQPAVSQLEHDGPAVCDVRVLRRVAKALQVPLAVLVVESDEEADVQRRQFFRAGAVGVGAAVLHGRQPPSNAAASARVNVGRTDVDRIVHSVNQIHQLQLVAGGDRLCEVAANEARYVEHLLDHGSYTDKVGNALTGAAAEMMTAAGWVHYDAGQWKEARRYYADAAQAATICGDGVAAAHAWINACLLSYREGSRPREGFNWPKPRSSRPGELAARNCGLWPLSVKPRLTASSAIGPRRLRRSTERTAPTSQPGAVIRHTLTICPKRS